MNEEYFSACLFLLISRVNKNRIDQYDNEQILNFYSLLKEDYFKDTGIDININIPEEREKLFSWSYEKYRMTILNALIEMNIEILKGPQQIEGETLDKTDLFFYHNISGMISLMIEQFYISSTYCSEKKVALTVLDDKTKKQIIKEIFAFIDPSLTWYNIYLEILNNGQIINITALSSDDKLRIVHKLNMPEFPNDENFVLPMEGKPYIFLTPNNTIQDIRIFFHEFAHFISFANEKGKTPRMLLEFSSCFYELITLYYFQKKGVDSEKLAYVNSRRLLNSASLALSEIQTLTYMLNYIKEGPISFEKEKQKYVESLTGLQNIMSQKLKSILQSDSKYSNVDQIIKSSIDSHIEELILNPFNFHEAYPYIIGNYLAIKMLNNLDSEVLAYMKTATEHPDEIEPFAVFAKLGLDKKLNLKKVEPSESPKL